MEARHLPRDAGCRVARAIVEHDHLEVRVILCQQGGETVADVACLVAHGEHNRECGQRGAGRGTVCGGEDRDAKTQVEQDTEGP